MKDFREIIEDEIREELLNEAKPDFVSGSGLPKVSIKNAPKTADKKLIDKVGKSITKQLVGLTTGSPATFTNIDIIFKVKKM